MHADLMRASRPDAHLQKGELLESTQYAVLAPGRATLVQPRGHPYSSDRVARNRPIDPPGVRRHAAMHQREVDLLDLPARKLRGQALMSGVILRDQQHTAREPV